MARTGKTTSKRSADVDAAVRRALAGGRAAALTQRLLPWYDRERRDLPWRRTRDPYAIWVSEVMLQQTQVETVLPYYRRFLGRFPRLADLAAAPESEVLRVWEGLGYYARARRLREAARLVVDQRDGELPTTVEELRTLPGIGPYSAAAIASIAHGRRAAVVDGNVERLIVRLFGLRGLPKRAPLARTLREIAEALVPDGRSSAHNQAMMELGATVCTPRRPRCDACPVAQVCAARRRGLVNRLPERPPRRSATPVRSVAALVVRGGRYLLTRRGNESPRWGGLWTFPTDDLRRAETPEAAVRRAVLEQTGVLTSARALATVTRFTVTRFRITLDVYACTPGSGAAKPLRAAEVAWVRAEDLDALPMPNGHRVVAALCRARGST